MPNSFPTKDTKMNNDNEIENENENSTSVASTTENVSTDASKPTVQDDDLFDDEDEGDDEDGEDFDDEEDEEDEDADSENDAEVTGSATGAIPAFGASGTAESSEPAPTDPVGSIKVTFTGVRVDNIATVEVPAGSTLSDALAHTDLSFDGVTYKTETSAALHAKDVLNEDVTISVINN